MQMLIYRYSDWDSFNIHRLKGEKHKRKLMCLAIFLHLQYFHFFKRNNVFVFTYSICGIKWIKG